MNTGELKRIIENALSEDVSRGDITTEILIPKNQISRAIIVTREEAVICGLDIARGVFHKCDKNLKIRCYYKDGDRVPSGARIVSIVGKTGAILTAERVALNFLSHLSGIATITAAFVKQIYPYQAKITDTRKTTMGLRKLEKYAVHCAGGINHRFNLNDMVLIKDNHRVACQKKMSLQDMVKCAKKRTRKLVEIEVDNLRQFRQVLSTQADVILLDNMPLPQIKRAVAMTKLIPQTKRPALEVSGGVNLKNVRAIAKTGIERIAIGALTHSRKNIDIALELLSS